MAAPSSTDHPIQRAPSAWRRWLPRIVVLAMVAWFGWYAYQRVVLEPDPRTEYWQAQVDQLCPIPSDAMPLDELAQLLSVTPWEPAGQTTGLAPRQRPNYHEIAILQLGAWDATDRPDHDVYLRLLAVPDVRAIRAEMIDAVKKPWPFQCTINTVMMPPSLSPNAWIKFLLSDSRHAIEVHADRASAIENWVTLYRMSLQYAAIPHTLYQIYARIIQTSMATEILYLPNEVDGPWPIEELADLVLGQPPRFENASELLAADRLQMRAELDKYFVGNAGWMDVSKYVSDISPTKPATRWWNLTSPIFYSRDELETQQREFWQSLDSANCILDVLAYEQTLEHTSLSNSWGARVILKPDPCAAETNWSWKSPTLYSLPSNFATRTKLEAAVTCLALENYRIDHGAFPETLDELVPTKLPRVPVDYVTMHPLRYRRDHQRYQLYSVGFDGTDNDGRTDIGVPDQRDLWEKSGYDMVFSDRDRPDIGQP